MKFLQAALLALTVSACSALPMGPDPADVALLRIGETTEAEAIQILGLPPDGRSLESDGTLVLRWDNGMPDSRSQRHDSVRLYFDRDGILKRVKRSSDATDPRNAYGRGYKK